MIQETHALGIQADWKIDSAGTAGYHVGEPPDSRAVAEVRKGYGEKMLPVTTRARQVRVSDFTEFEYILCMDESNLANLQRLAKSTTPTAKIALLGSYDPEGERIISDPYYGGQSGFAHNLAQIQRSIGALLAENGYGAVDKEAAK